MPHRKRPLTVLLIAALALASGCGDRDRPTEEELAETVRKLDAATGNLEEATRQLAETEAARAADQNAGQTATDETTPAVESPVVPVAYSPPPDHLEPFDERFAFGDADRVAHFWRWNHNWSFTDDRARNAKWENFTFIASRYALVGDFQINLQGMMSRSFTNAKRPHLHVAGQEIKLIASSGKANVDLIVERVGKKLYYTVVPNEPQVVELTDEQAGPTEVLLRFHNRHATIQRFDLRADAADRIVQ